MGQPLPRRSGASLPLPWRGHSAPRLCQAGSLKALDAQSVADPSTDGGEQASRFRAPWGVPRVITDPANPSPNGGLKDATVAFRTAALCLGASAVLLTLWWLCLKPLDPNRTTGNLVWALLFAACAVMAFIALATAAGDVHSAQDCPWGVAASYAKCESLATLATVCVCVGKGSVHGKSGGRDATVQSTAANPAGVDTAHTPPVWSTAAAPQLARPAVAARGRMHCSQGSPKQRRAAATPHLALG